METKCLIVKIKSKKTGQEYYQLQVPMIGHSALLNETEVKLLETIIELEKIKKGGK